MLEKIKTVLSTTCDVLKRSLECLSEAAKGWAMEKKQENLVAQTRMQKSHNIYVYTNFKGEYEQVADLLQVCIKDNYHMCGLASCATRYGIYVPYEDRVKIYPKCISFTYQVQRYNSDLYGGGMKPVETKPVANVMIQKVLSERFPNYLECVNAKLVGIHVSPGTDDRVVIELGLVPLM